ncbi:sigma-E processing peptidase SpoIIGA [Alteribacter natronophilus]|uniref:sigma-E processing peptidase SpoIIGA n=1 Tax=Alteribacter natronophilus TaxID=2583810 RepID=UPI00110DEF32|nr:sigma-E processing peptidase SpoIIGA [Alteribacter natronophilus]TMW73133.1 sigma-E processing peptidase SpoIIGA [Alteribacter natronophilus]
MTLYLDVIWLLNFLVDWMLLALTALALKRGVTKKRLAGGAFIASLYLFLLFSPAAHIAASPLFKIVYSAVIVWSTFGFKGFKPFCKAWMMFYFVSFMTGGGLIAAHAFFSTEILIINDTFATRLNGFGSPASWLFVVLGFPAVWYFSRKSIGGIETAKIRFDQIMKVRIRTRGIDLELKGFVDSGNQLKDPISSRPVMIIDMTKLKDSFPDELVQFTEKGTESITDFRSAEEYAMTLVPYRTVAGGHQFLWCLKPDLVTVFPDGEKEAFDCTRVLIGLSYSPLSSLGDYECILHPGMFQERKQSPA